MKNILTIVKTIEIKLSESKSFTILMLFSLLFTQSVYCQEQDTLKKDRKNTIRFNITNPMLFGKNNYILGYERTLGRHQSFTFNAGMFSLPKLLNINTDSIAYLSSTNNSRGINFSGDYRFYLSKENKYNAPHGVYIGPYATYTNFDRKYEFVANTAVFEGTLNTDFNFSVASLGFQLGYQFIFWDRVTLDMMLFGPGIAAYKIKASLSTSLSADQEAELFQKINDALKEKIPGYSLVIEPKSFEKTGRVNTTSLGYRYLIMVGFRF